MEKRGPVWDRKRDSENGFGGRRDREEGGEVPERSVIENRGRTGNTERGANQCRQREDISLRASPRSPISLMEPLQWTPSWNNSILVRDTTDGTGRTSMSI